MRCARHRVVCPPRRILLFCLALLTPACTAWRPYTSNSTPTDLPDRIRLHLRSGATVTMDVVALEGDSVWVGFVGEGRPVRIPSEQVVSAEASRTHPTVVAAGVVAVAVGVSLAVWAVTYSAAGRE